VQKDELRLIGIEDFDLTACGGTHVTGTGQIGCILLRKTERVKQQWRVEFVCGKRSVSTARHDFSTLTEAAALFSSHIRDVPQQVRNTQDEVRVLRKARSAAWEEVADLYATRMLAEAEETAGRKVIVHTYVDRDLGFIKLLAQRITRQGANAIALLASVSDQPAMVFAASPGQPFDMGALMKEALSRLGGRGGGSKDMAQGGPQNVEMIPATLAELRQKLA
jgi:alanyl-tRNA synthetase